MELKSTPAAAQLSLSTVLRRCAGKLAPGREEAARAIPRYAKKCPMDIHHGCPCHGRASRCPRCPSSGPVPSRRAVEWPRSRGTWLHLVAPGLLPLRQLAAPLGWAGPGPSRPRPSHNTVQITRRQPIHIQIHVRAWCPVPFRARARQLSNAQRRGWARIFIGGSSEQSWPFRRRRSLQSPAEPRAIPRQIARTVMLLLPLLSRRSGPILLLGRGDASHMARRDVLRFAN